MNSSTPQPFFMRLPRSLPEDIKDY
jgi:hypothetical protein